MQPQETPPAQPNPQGTAPASAGETPQPGPAADHPSAASQPIAPSSVAPQPMMANSVPLQTTAPATSLGQSVKLEHLRRTSLIFSIASLAVLAAGLIVGVVAVVGAALGAYGAQRGRIAHYRPGFIIGLVGFVLNLGYYFFAVIILHYR